jgi:hypothetical protein
MAASCAQPQSFDGRLGQIVKPYRFDLASWQLQALSYELDDWLFSRQEAPGDASVVIEYFSIHEQARALETEVEAVRTGALPGDLASLEGRLDRLRDEENSLRGRAEKILEKQITETLAQLGIFNPADSLTRLEFTFPPVSFRLEAPPHLLVVSPRDSIESLREITLLQEITPQEMEAIEAAVDELEVSSLVVGLGGIATYPAFVASDAGLQFAINAAVEEWLHQYLFLRPLGFLYALDLLGAYPNYEIAVMNETTVGIASGEIGAALYQSYYAQYGDSQVEVAEPEFDFYLEMWQIRKTVDEYLAQGEIDRAEQFMEQKRLFLASKGYFIRKLNQAYFAFYGTYADSPGSISPIGIELRELRAKSPGLSEFLSAVAAMTSRSDLIASLK